MRMAFTAQSFVGKVIDISYEVIDMFKYIIKKILMMIPMLKTVGWFQEKRELPEIIIQDRTE